MDSRDVKVIISYALSFIGGIAIMAIYPNDSYLRFHAMQSTVMGCIVLILGSVSRLLSWIPIISFFMWTIVSVAGIAWLVATIFCIVKGVNNEEYHLPFIGDIAEKLAR